MSSGSAEAILAIPALAAPEGGDRELNQVGVDIDLDAIVDAVEADGVYAPAGVDEAELLEIVAQARAAGDSLHIVVVDVVQPKFTVYRDIATEVQSVTGGTVLVFGPNSVGSASDEFSRVVLENAGEELPLGEPSVAARQMYDDMTAPSVDWTVVTIVLVVVVVLAAVAGRLLGLRRRAAAEQSDPAAAESGTPRSDAPGSDAAGSDAAVSGDSDPVADVDSIDGGLPADRG